MAQTAEIDIADLLNRNESAILAEWTRLQLADARRSHMLDDAEVRRQSREFLSLVRTAAQSGQLQNVQAREWDGVRQMLDDLSRSRARQGFTPSETALFVFSLKEALFSTLQTALKDAPERLASAMWTVSSLLDRLGLFTTEVFQKGREEVISRQQEEMLELSTPVVELWAGVLALPLIGISASWISPSAITKTRCWRSTPTVSSRAKRRIRRWSASMRSARNSRRGAA